MDEIERFMHKGISDKDKNSLLGFIEGIVMDGSVNEFEVDALIGWNNHNDNLLVNPPFNTLLPILSEITTKNGIDNLVKEQFLSLVASLKSTAFFKSGTADIQRLHGILAGLVCDKTLSHAELIALNAWLKNNDHLEDDHIYQDVYRLLRPIRTKGELSDDELSSVFLQIKKHVDIDNHGLLRTSLTHSESNENPDFHHGHIRLEGHTYCFTGASERYTKNEWKELVESKGAGFADDMKKSIDYLVICNKGNRAWAHVSYGRKFEVAKKLQDNGGMIKILTEDHFISMVEAFDRMK